MTTNPDPTRKLAMRIVDTWPNGPKAYIWIEVLADLDITAAEKAYRALRDELPGTQRVAPADLKRHYREHANTTRRTEPAGCHLCDGHGWRPVTIEHHSHVYDATEACTCPAGQANRDAQRRIVDANERELNRLFPDRQTTPQQDTLDANF